MRRILLFAFLILSPSVHADVTSGLVGWWKLDEGSGTSAGDSSGQGNTGTLTNGPSWVTGKRGGALSFDGTDDWVDFGDPAVLHPSVLTLSAWAIVPPGSDYSVIIDRAKSLWTSYMLNINSGKAEVSIGYVDAPPYAGSVVSSGSVDDGAWHHLAGTYDGSNIRVYVDGVLQGTTAFSQPILYSGSSAAETVRLGQHVGEALSYFQGSIDDARIYNRALTAQEINAIYIAAESRFKAGGGARLTGMKMN